MLPRQLPIFVIRLDNARDGVGSTSLAFSELSSVQPIDISPLALDDLPLCAKRMLCDPQKAGEGVGGDLSHWISHLSAWERIASGRWGWGLVLESGVRPRGFNRLFRAPIPEDADILWVNRRMDANLPAGADRAPAVVEIAAAVKQKVGLQPKKAAPGSDGYLLSRRGAQKLADAAASEGMHGSVEWRMLRYAISEDYARAICDPWWAEKQRGLFSFGETVGWSKLAGYALSPHVVSDRGAPPA